MTYRISKGHKTFNTPYATRAEAVAFLRDIFAKDTGFEVLVDEADDVEDGHDFAVLKRGEVTIFSVDKRSS